MRKLFRYALFVLATILLPAGALHAGEVNRPIAAWPFLYHKSDARQSETDILWPLLRHERRGSFNRYALRPLIFATESDPERDYRQTSFIWPISIYEHRRDETWFHLFPIYWYNRTPRHFHNVLFPVYWDIEDEHSSAFHLWPLFGINRRDPAWVEYSTLYPFFRYGSDQQGDDFVLDLFWPLVNAEHRGDYRSHRLLPLYWYEEETSGSGGFVFPYYWRNRPEVTERGILPLWYSSRKPGETLDLVLPLYYDSKNDQRQLTFITPLFARRVSDESRLTTLIPLYVDYKEAEYRLQIGLPLWYNYRNGPFTFTSLFPLYYASEDTAERSATTYYFPLYGSYRRGETVSRHFFLFPLYSKFTDQEMDLAGWDLLWPLVHYESSPTTKSVRLLPLYWHSSKPGFEFSIFFPLYWSLTDGEATYRHFLPLYGVHEKGGGYRKRFVLGPVFMDTRDERRGLSQQDFLYPFASFRRKGEERLDWFFPFYYHREDPGTSATLGALALLPPYYIHTQEPGEEILHLWPFWGSLHKGSYSEYSSLWPLIRFGHDRQDDSSLTHLLLYYRRTEPEASLTTLFPLWLHRDNPSVTEDGSLFVHWYRHEKGRDLTSFSFLWLIPEYASLVSYQRGPQLMEHGLFPLYRYHHELSRDELSWSLLWPFFHYRSQGEEVRQTAFLFQLLSYERKSAEESEFRFLWRFIRKKKSPTARVFEFNPLYYSEAEEGNGSYWAILGGLFGRETTPDGGHNYRFFWFL